MRVDTVMAREHEDRESPVNLQRGVARALRNGTQNAREMGKASSRNFAFLVRPECAGLSFFHNSVLAHH